MSEENEDENWINIKQRVMKTKKFKLRKKKYLNARKEYIEFLTRNPSDRRLFEYLWFFDYWYFTPPKEWSET